MKSITEQIIKKLDSEALLKSLENHLTTNPELVEGDVSFSEAYEKFQFLKTSVLQSVEAEIFEKTCALNRRNSINSQLNNLVQNKDNINQVINQIETIYDQLMISGALDPFQEKAIYQEKLSHLTKLIRRYNGYIDQLKVARKDFTFIAGKRKELEELIKEIEEKNSQVETSLQQIAEHTSKASSEASQVAESLDKARRDGEQIETQKSQINAFFTNIEEYKQSIEDLKSKAKAVVDKDAIVNQLIEDAKNALKLNSAVGISAAFAAQYEAANSKKIYNSWLWGAGVFLAIALGLTIWVVGGWGIINNESISSIVGRVVAVGVAISGATFCAKRFVTQKNLAEDYAYKATLSKSIVAFKDEIKSGDPKQVAEYLTTVLAEIHKDPMRSRVSSKEDGFTISDKSIGFIEKLKDVFK